MVGRKFPRFVASTCAVADTDASSDAYTYERQPLIVFKLIRLHLFEYSDRIS